jgi:LysM repeat protein
VTAAPTRRRAGAWLAVAVAVVAVGRTAHAQDANRPVTYRVRQGDTLELIAAEFYGDRSKATFIVTENKLTHPRPLKPGERLRIPVSHEITTSPGDTFESLAMTHLGSARRGAFLADWAGMSHDDSLPAGTAITIPLTVAHVAQATESLADIARLYFGDARSAEMLRHYNQLDKPSVDKGETVQVPGYHVKLSPAKQPPLDAESRARRDHRREALARGWPGRPATSPRSRTGCPGSSPISTTSTPTTRSSSGCCSAPPTSRSTRPSPRWCGSSARSTARPSMRCGATTTRPRSSRCGREPAGRSSEPGPPGRALPREIAVLCSGRRCPRRPRKNSSARGAGHRSTVRAGSAPSAAPT